MWIVLGGIFLGAVHDFVATHIAVREGGKNLTVVTRRYVGRVAFVLMLIMLVALLVLVCAAFLDLSARALTSQVPTRDLKLPASQTLFRMREGLAFTIDAKKLPGEGSEQDLLSACRPAFAAQGMELSSAAALETIAPGAEWRLVDADASFRLARTAAGLNVFERQAVIGGIASTSVVVITAFSPLLGFLYLKRKTPVWVCSLLAVAICAGSIVIGLYLPMAVSPLTWKLLISGYVLVAAGLPVWLFLQSRDFINVHILYVGLACVSAALVAAAVRGGGEFASAGAIPVSNWATASAKLGPGWPMLFVMIACGAVSGFHSLCAGGTTCKQLRTEAAARHVGYYAMLLESFLALCVVLCMVVGLSLSGYYAYRFVHSGAGNPVLTFAMAVGNTAHVGLGLPVAVGALGAMLLLEGFLVTTLDTAVRLTRYMIEEGWATLFRSYDVFAPSRAPATAGASGRGSLELVGTGGLSADRQSVEYARHVVDAGPDVRVASGPLRAVLVVLKQYWVNSGIAVALMLVLGLGNGYNVVWKIFGSSNQLLAALALIVGTCWLMVRGRPVWYTLLPALFMLATSVTALVRELVLIYIPGWPGTAALAVTACVVLAVTAGLLVAVLARWLRPARAVRATA